VRRLAIALVHHPVLDGQGAIVTTAVTNLDVHDLARSARSYGCSDYFVVHPIAAQRELVERIRSHWTDGSSGKRIPDRKEALTVLRIVPSLDDAIEALAAGCPANAGGARAAVEVWVTAARKLRPARTFASARDALHGEGKPVLLVFGTGWGLAPAVVDAADALLEPIAAAAPRPAGADYNHLSVRAACAIALDRLMGAR
jgi:hypothetical protein